MEPIISFDHFGFQYTAQAEPTLYDISLDIRKGEKVLICGLRQVYPGPLRQRPDPQFLSGENHGNPHRWRPERGKSEPV